MRLAVGQGHLDVDDGPAGKQPLGQLGVRALLDAADELPWHGATDDHLVELVARAARKGVDRHVHDRELAVTAGLFDMPTLR